MWFQNVGSECLSCVCTYSSRDQRFIFVRLWEMMDIAMEYMIFFLFFGGEEYCFEEKLKTRDLFLQS